MTDLLDTAIYARIGEDGFARLVAAFYRRVAADDVVGRMYPADHLPAAERRLRDFLVQRFGGPTRYSDERGNPRLRMRHAPFAVDLPARDRWVALMEEALAEAALPEDVTRVLRAFFSDSATFLLNRD